MAIVVLDSGNAHHAAAVTAIGQARREALVLSASAYAEVLVDPRRRGPEAVSVVRQLVADLGIHVEPLTANAAEGAARLRARHRALRLPDALDATALTSDRARTRMTRRARVV